MVQMMTLTWKATWFNIFLKLYPQYSSIPKMSLPSYATVCYPLIGYNVAVSYSFSFQLSHKNGLFLVTLHLTWLGNALFNFSILNLESINTQRDYFSLYEK